MATLSEDNITPLFTSLPVNMEHLTRCARQNLVTAEGVEYISYISSFIRKKELCEMFGITGSLGEKWEYSGTDFVLRVTVSSDVITKICIDKYREYGGGHGRPLVRPLKITQQELRIARRILEYITK